MEGPSQEARPRRVEMEVCSVWRLLRYGEATLEVCWKTRILVVGDHEDYFYAHVGELSAPVENNVNFIF